MAADLIIEGRSIVAAPKFAISYDGHNFTIWSNGMEVSILSRQQTRELIAYIQKLESSPTTVTGDIQP